MSFILHIQRFTCSNCNNAWNSSNFYEVVTTGITNLKPSTVTPPPGTAFGITRLPPRPVPVCYACAEDLATLRTLQRQALESEWAATLRRKQEQQLELAKTELRGGSGSGAQTSHRTYAPSIDEL